MLQGEPDVVEAFQQPPARVVVNLERGNHIAAFDGLGHEVHLDLGAGVVLQHLPDELDVVLGNLGLTEAQSAAFMPIYDEYTTAMKANWDKRIQLIKDYAAKYETMNDEMAASLMKRNTTLEKESLALRDKYAKKVMKVLPTTIAARWMQIENRLSKAIDLQIASELPLMPTRK